MLSSSLVGGGSTPKETFYHLNEAKRQKIYAAAVKEFAARRFSEASINQIVKAADIPRGSFYQYFADKEDLFRYVFAEILREKMAILQAEPFDPKADVFELCIQATRVSYERGKDRPEYDQIGMLMEMDNSPFITDLRAASAQGFRELIERDKGRGLIKPEADTDLIADILNTLIIKEYFLTGMDKQAFLNRISAVVKIIKEGVATNRE